jgi:hypothetical protein
MLSPVTLVMLASLQEASHLAYSEGGLLYTYIEAANQAHFRLPIESSRSSVLSPSEVHELGRFLQASQGQYQSEVGSPTYLTLAEELLRLLQNDLKFDEVAWSFEDGGHDMSANIKMTKRAENRFFSLELMWSVD